MNIESHSPEYAAEVERLLLLEGLSPDTVAAICEPQMLFVTEEYRAAPVRVMIVGQETGDADKWLTEVVEEGYDAMIARRRHRFAEVDFCRRASFSPFWRGYDDVCTAFGVSRSATAWTNICKVQLGEAVAGSVSMMKLSAEARMEIVRWQRMMTLAELEYAKPDVIVHFTGGMQWIAGHLYRSNALSKRSDVVEHVIEGAGPSSGFMTAPLLGRAISVFTSHPNGGRTSEGKAGIVSDRRVVLDWAVGRLRERQG
jgi:hypothetical protein